MLARWPFLQRLLRSLGQERRCLACTLIFRDEDVTALFCPDCTAAMPRKQRGFCPSCGEPAAWPELSPALCAHCLDDPPLWQNFIFHGPYEGLLRNLLIGLKFRSKPFLGHALGTLLATHPGFTSLSADLVIPVPLHPSRLAQRGYNQAQEIARPLARHFSLPLMPDLLSRIVPTAPQTSASRNERKKNIRNAFTIQKAALKAIGGAHVLLVDDTLTTGATVVAATRTLLASGASGVSVAVVGRTALHG